MADVKVTGIEGTLKQAQDSATSERNALKGGNKKLGKIIALLIVAVAIGLLWRDFQQEKKESAGKTASAPEPSAAADVAAVENVLTLGQNQCTEPILLQNGWCISARGEEADVSNIRTEVLNMSTSAWELLPPGAFRKARYWRYCATEPNTKVFYSVYRKPQEGCNSNTR